MADEDALVCANCAEPEEVVQWVTDMVFFEDIMMSEEP